MKRGDSTSSPGGKKTDSGTGRKGRTPRSKNGSSSKSRIRSAVETAALALSTSVADRERELPRGAISPAGNPLIAETSSPEENVTLTDPETLRAMLREPEDSEITLPAAGEEIASPASAEAMPSPEALREMLKEPRTEPDEARLKPSDPVAEGGAAVETEPQREVPSQGTAAISASPSEDLPLDPPEKESAEAGRPAEAAAQPEITADLMPPEVEKADCDLRSPTDGAPQTEAVISGADPANASVNAPVAESAGAEIAAAPALPVPQTDAAISGSAPAAESGNNPAPDPVATEAVATEAKVAAAPQDGDGMSASEAVASPADIHESNPVPTEPSVAEMTVPDEVVPPVAPEVAADEVASAAAGAQDPEAPGNAAAGDGAAAKTAAVVAAAAVPLVAGSDRKIVYPPAPEQSAPKHRGGIWNQLSRIGWWRIRKGPRSPLDISKLRQKVKLREYRRLLQQVTFSPYRMLRLGVLTLLWALIGCGAFQFWMLLNCDIARNEVRDLVNSDLLAVQQRYALPGTSKELLGTRALNFKRPKLIGPEDKAAGKEKLEFIPVIGQRAKIREGEWAVRYIRDPASRTEKPAPKS